jgi:ribonuclease Z
MPLSVLILGSGSALPTISSNQSAQVVETGNQLFLVDCGEGTQIALRRNKVKIQKIHHVFISHLHGDHFFGLVGLLSTMHLLGRKKELHIHGPLGLEEIVQIQFRNAGSHLSFEMIFHSMEKGGELLYEDSKVSIHSLPLKHRIPCYGFYFQEKPGPRKLKVAALKKYRVPTYARKGLTEGADFQLEDGTVIPNKEMTEDPPAPRSYAYCSDTAFYEKLIPLLEGVDLLYHESTFLKADAQRAKKTYHSTAEDAATVAKEAGVGKLLLGHFSNRYEKKEWFLEEARAIFEAAYIAEEGELFAC